VLCDAVASDNPIFNAIERHRDPSTVEFRTLHFLIDLFTAASLPAPAVTRCQVPVEFERLLAVSFPTNGDRDSLRRMVTDSIEGDTLEIKTRRDEDMIRFDYRAAILVSTKR
jgi:hypothetical protein